jgi:hypothetical protein
MLIGTRIALSAKCWVHSFTYGAEPFLRSRKLCSYSRTSQYFMEPEGSLVCSQEPDQSNPYHPILFIPHQNILLCCYRISTANLNRIFYLPTYHFSASSHRRFYILCFIKGKAIPVRPWRPLELREVEARRWRQGCQLFTSRKIPGTHFC